MPVEGTYLRLVRRESYRAPPRRTMVHLACHQMTVVPLLVGYLMEDDPAFYVVTFCVHCHGWFPVAEFAWKDGTLVGTSICYRQSLDSSS